MANVEFGTGKTVLILAIVAACFAVLWPKIFYPMLVSSPVGKPQSDNINGCCDVIFETDVNAIKIMSEMCGSIFRRHQELDPKLMRAFQEGKYSKGLVDICRSEVKSICGIDIAEILNEKVRLGHSYKQILDEIRSYNISVCLRQNFGISPGSLGTPRRMRLWGLTTSRHLRQERPLHLRPEIMHPALRERGRAIPQSSPSPKVALEAEANVRPPPIPGMRPPMGGAGHVVPPPKVGPTMSILMPLYTIAIVIFSMYTMMKFFIRKTGSNDNYKDFSSDPEFRRFVFAEECGNGCAGSVKDDGLRTRSKRDAPAPVWKTPTDEGTRLVMTAITGLLAEVDQQLSREGDTQTQYSTDLKEEKKNLEEICTEGIRPSGKRDLSKTEQVDKWSESVHQYMVSDRTDDEPVRGEIAAGDSKPKVKVMGVETVEECEGGQKWSRPATPNLGVTAMTRGSFHGKQPPEDVEPLDIFLEGSLPTQSQLLVTDSKTQTLTLPAEDGPESPVILSGKVTLSLISLDARLPEDRSTEAQPVPVSRYQCDFDVKSDYFGDAESTLLDVDSTVIDEIESLTHDQAVAENDCEESSKVDDDLTNYTTATMSEDADAAEVEDTHADMSNIDALDTAEDQDDLEEEGHVWNGLEGENRISFLRNDDKNNE